MSFRRRGARAALALSGTLVFVAAACTDDDGTTSTTTTEAPPTTEPAPRVDDGELSIGVLLPVDAPLVADAITTTAQRVVEEINAAGGVLGTDVSLTTVDEGGSASEVTQAVTTLIDDGVDAVIGPITSTNAVTAIDVASAAGVVTCSPTATSSLLDDVPDELLFFRTIASDTMQAIAIAEAAENTGARSVAVVHVDDAYGRPYATSVETALEDRTLDIDGVFSFAADDDLEAVASEAAAENSDVLVVLAAGPELAAFLTALDARSTAIGFDTIITNDAVRRAANQPVIAELSPDLRSRLLGVAPQITDRRVDADASVFGPQVTDCLTVLALATVQAGSDDPRLIAGQIPPVSSGGRLCRTFESCAAQIELERQIDYNGPTGLTELNRVGETARAWFERFTFDDDGTDRFDESARLQVAI